MNVCMCVPMCPWEYVCNNNQRERGHEFDREVGFEGGEEGGNYVII